MDNSFDFLNLIAIIVGPLLGIIGGAFAVIKIFFRYKSRILFITNCQILHKKIWEDLVDYYDIKTFGPHDHAFRPLVLLPQEMKKYISIPNGGKAILESISKEHENSLKIIAEVYWIPNLPDHEASESMKLWKEIKHPVFSLILRRYFGIERPMYQDEEKPKGPWEKVEHYITYLDPLNRVNDTDDRKLQWAVSENITYRYFNPGKKGSDKYEPVPSEKSFIEYCGLSISLRRRSWMHIERE